MKCSRCQHDDTKVIESRDVADGDAIHGIEAFRRTRADWESFSFGLGRGNCRQRDDGSIYPVPRQVGFAGRAATPRYDKDTDAR